MSMPRFHFGSPLKWIYIDSPEVEEILKSSSNNESFLQLELKPSESGLFSSIPTKEIEFKKKEKKTPNMFTFSDEDIKRSQSLENNTPEDLQFYYILQIERELISGKRSPVTLTLKK